MMNAGNGRERKTMDELKPCPFCDGAADVLIDLDNAYSGIPHKWYVVCRECCTHSGLFVSREDAIEAWNRTADNDKL